MPSPDGEFIATPQEENARMLQGDTIIPAPEDDHISHIREHRTFLLDPLVPDQAKNLVVDHINEHVKVMQSVIATQLASQQAGFPSVPQGVPNAGQARTPQTVFQGQSPRVGRPETGNETLFG